MTSHSECEDKECPTCRFRAVIQELHDDGVPMDLAVSIMMVAAGEVYGVNFGMVEVRKEALH